MEPTKEKNTHMELQVKHKDTNDKRFRSTQSIETIYYDEVDYPAVGKRRNVEERAGYNEYCDLWREFIELQTVVLWRNKPMKDTVVIPRIQTLIEDLGRKHPEIEKNEKDLKMKTTQLEAIQSEEDQKRTELTDISKLKTKTDDQKKQEATLTLELQSDRFTKDKPQLKTDIIQLKSALEKLTLIRLKLKEYKEYMDFHASLWANMTSLIENLSKNEYVQGRNQNNSFNIENYKRSLYDMINK